MSVAPHNIPERRPRARSRFAVAVSFAFALCRCGGSGSSGAAASGTSTGSDQGSGSGAADEGGIIFASLPSSSASDDASDASDNSSDASGDSSDVALDTFVCDPTLTPKDDPCIINDAYAVFVAAPVSADGGAGGSDVTGLGTMAMPFATIGKALQNLSGKSRVYVCGGTYVEAVTVDTTHVASLYGGLTCASGPGGLTWRYEGAVAQVRPAAAGQPALSVSAAADPVAIEDMGFESPAAQSQDSSGAGLSSIAAWVQGSTVSFSRVVLTAGNAADGANGTTQVNYDPSATTAPGPRSATNANSQTCPPGAMSPPADESVGGEGAVGSAQGMPGTSDPATGGVAPRDGQGGLGEQGDYAAPGDDGADGNVRSPGMAAGTLGTLTDTGWAPAPGGDGAPGAPGQGGGGGGRLGIPPNLTTYYFGGAGGTGGCGGGGGGGGKGGGASVALFSVSSTVTLTACQLTSNQPGAGGNGAPGAPGQAGSPGSQVLYAGSGGMGGNGAGGSGGAGGTGGMSAGIIYRGSEPIRDATTLISLGQGSGAGAPGMGGAGGTGGSNTSGTAPSASAGAPGLPGAYFAAHDIDAP